MKAKKILSFAVALVMLLCMVNIPAFAEESAAPTGTLEVAYTSDNTYYGECGGNADESFEFKFYNDNTYMGYTSLNDVDNIIDGDVYVTWHIKLDAASNEDDYWDMGWEIAPTVAMQPNRVEQWVDGIKVAECAISPNGPDNLFIVIAATYDDSGKITGYIRRAHNSDGSAELQNALSNGGNIAILDDLKLNSAVVIPENTTAIIDLNGKTIDAGYQSGSDSKHIYVIQNKGTLTLKNGTINARGVGNYGTLVIESGTYNAIDTNGGASVWNYEGSALTIIDGTFTAAETSNSPAACTVNVAKNSTAIINDGTFTCNADLTYAVINEGMLTVKDGHFVGDHGVFSTISGSTLVVDDGYFETIGNGHVVYTTTANITLNGGSYKHSQVGASAHGNVILFADGTAQATVNGGSYDSVEAAFAYSRMNNNIEIKGGKFAGAAVNVYQQSSNEGVAEFVADGYNLTQNEDGTFGVIESDNDIFGGRFAIINMPMVDGNYRCAFVSGIDSLKYKEVGFKFYCNGEEIGAKSTKRVYSTIKVTSTSGDVTTVTAEDIGAYRMFYQGAQFNPEKYDNTPIQYQPYAITLDGELVLGDMITLEDIYTLDN